MVEGEHTSPVLHNLAGDHGKGGGLAQRLS